MIKNHLWEKPQAQLRIRYLNNQLPALICSRCGMVKTRKGLIFSYVGTNGSLQPGFIRPTPFGKKEEMASITRFDLSPERVDFYQLRHIKTHCKDEVVRQVMLA